MSFTLGRKSESNLVGAHPHLDRIVRLAIQLTPVDFTVLEGGRTQLRQRQLVDSGVSWTMSSRHLYDAAGLFYAVDLGVWRDGAVYWPPAEDGPSDASWDPFHALAGAVKLAACRLGFPVEWGVDLWNKDAPHYQLPWAEYPPQRR